MSEWPRGIRRGSGALPVRITSGPWMPVYCCLCCQVEVFATGRSLIQRNLTECGVSECDREASIMRRPWPTRGCRAMRWGVGETDE